MADRDDGHRRETAARWYTELQDPGVSAETWEAFLEWEKDPTNAAAYREIEVALGVLDRTSISRPNTAEQSRPTRTRKPILLGLAAAAALVLGLMAFNFQSLDSESAALTYATAIGEQKTVSLQDGSIITLNTNTKLSVSYSGAERFISLIQGEALFTVEHSDRPFIVEANGISTRALGTEFDIHTEEKSVSVTLIEGSVRVTQSQPETGTDRPGEVSNESRQAGIVLKPGDRLDISPGKAPILSAIDTALAVTWREGFLHFDNTTLAEAIAEMNRYSTTKLRIVDETLADERISGTFPAGEQEAFAESLKLYLPVEVTDFNGEILVSPEAD